MNLWLNNKDRQLNQHKQNKKYQTLRLQSTSLFDVDIEMSSSECEIEMRNDSLYLLLEFCLKGFKYTADTLNTLNLILIFL